MPPKSALPFKGKQIIIAFDDDDTKWVTESIQKLGAQVNPKDTSGVHYVVGESVAKINKLVTDKPAKAKLLKKDFLLDALIQKKIPTPIASYVLKADLAAAKAALAEEDDLPPRKTDAKRTLADAPAEEEEAPAKKIAAPATNAVKGKSVAAPVSTGGSSAVPTMPSYKSVTMKWEKHDGTLLVHSSAELPGSPLVAAFDMDSTLVEPKSGAKFPKDRKDWRWLMPEVPTELKRLHKAGYKVIIFSNQAGISKGKQNASDLTGKIQDLSAEIDVPIVAFLATDNDKYRKPSTKMWSVFTSTFNNGVAVDMTKSFYIGDAAGRNVNWAPKKPKDHSVVDRKFAVNAGLPFFTPEEHFLGQASVPFNWRSLDPNDIIKEFAAVNGAMDDKAAAKKSALDSLIKTFGKTQEVIIMVGCPASGKSTFSERYLVPKGYVRVNRDTLGTPAKCLAAAKAAVAAGKSIVVDNTNGPKKNRADYLQVAKAAGIPARALHMETLDLLADHCNLIRMIVTGEKVPDIAYAMYRKGFEAPTTAEGFESVTKVPWVPVFDSDHDRLHFTQWTE